jgi:hypothetical protein
MPVTTWQGEHVRSGDIFEMEGRKADLGTKENPKVTWKKMQRHPMAHEIEGS